MTCRRLTPDVIDFARGLALHRSREAAVVEHLRSCPSCAALAERERTMTAALRELARDEHVPDQNELRLGRLLAIFDAPRQRSSRMTSVGLSLAASILIVVGLSVGWSSDAPKPSASGGVAVTPASPANAETAFDVAQAGPERSRGTGFVVLPGAQALPRLESGQVIRVELPSSDGAIQADVLIGQDGLARAVRLVQ
jgi:anti-sigma factor RsiW